MNEWFAEFLAGRSAAVLDRPAGGPPRRGSVAAGSRKLGCARGREVARDRSIGRTAPIVAARGCRRSLGRKPSRLCAFRSTHLSANRCPVLR